MTETRPSRGGEKSRVGRGAFTIVELLVVMGVIILLSGILVVAIAKASRISQSANTQVLLGSINQALVRFEADIGYLPPVLDKDRGFADPPDPALLSEDEYRDRIQLAPSIGQHHNAVLPAGYQWEKYFTDQGAGRTDLIPFGELDGWRVGLARWNILKRVGDRRILAERFGERIGPLMGKSDQPLRFRFGLTRRTDR